MNKSNKKIARLLALGLVSFGVGMLACPPAARAMTANPTPFVETQPDGTKVTLRLRGDEHYNWMEDMNGFTVVQDTKGAFVYGERNAVGNVVASPLQVGRDNPANAGLAPHVMPAPAVMEQSRLTAPPLSSNSVAGGPQAGPPPIGTRKNLVVLIRFSDHTTRPLPTRADFDILFNAPGGHPTLAPTGSVRDYYTENSNTQLTLQSTVLDWVTVPQTEAYYANGNSALSFPSRLWDALRFALDAADATIDFNDFDEDNDGFIDGMTFIHSGYAAEFGGTDSYGASSANRIWSHKWAIQPQWNSADGVTVYDYNVNPGVWGLSGSAIGRIGVICHETGHFFGLPDLYDTDPGAGEGIGSWGLMANSWGFDGSQYYPPHMCSWSKEQMGWLTPIELTAPGNYALPEYVTTGTAYKITANFPPGEYLLLENRQPIGFEADMPQGGLAVFHIDENAGYNTQGYPGQAGWPGNGNHYRVALLQADGDYDLERGNNRGDTGDVYHEGGVSTLGTSTVPNTDAYQGGNVYSTGITLLNIRKTGGNMSFTYSADAGNLLADIKFTDDSIGLSMPSAANLTHGSALLNDAAPGGQDLNFAITTSVDGEQEHTLGSTQFFYSPLTNLAVGNIFQVTSNTTLREIKAGLNFTGTAQLDFLVYQMPGLGTSDVKTRIFYLPLVFNGVGPALYASGEIDVELEAGSYYAIATGWTTPSISAYLNTAAQPSFSFGNKVLAFSFIYSPLPTSFTGNPGTLTYNFYQNLRFGADSWLGVDVPSGTLAPQTVQPLTFTANVAGFAPGTYGAEIQIASNDPDQGLLTVPVGVLIGLQNQIYVNFGFGGTEFGTMANPYNSMNEGLQALLSNGTLSILGGGQAPEVFLNVNKAVTIEAIGAEATIGGGIVAAGPVSPEIHENGDAALSLADNPDSRVVVIEVSPDSKPISNGRPPAMKAKDASAADSGPAKLVRPGKLSSIR